MHILTANSQADGAVSKLDSVVIHFRDKLLEKYGDKSRPNEQVGTYVYDDGQTVFLNQSRLGAWARLLVSQFSALLLY